MADVQHHPIDEHGGRLRRAAKRYGIPYEQWLDLSTGISPHGWAVGAIPPQVWQRLPEEDDGLEQAMQAYFGTSDVLPVAGSQTVIQALPRLRSPGRVAVLSPAYAEHAKAWQAAGHTVVALVAADVDPVLPSLDVLVVVNPNNPTGETQEPARLRAWHAQLSRRGGWLVVDEAFADAQPSTRVVGHAERNLVVLRSLGKFWGLAGLRVGFVLAAPELLALIGAWLGPWQVSHPGRWIATQALTDHRWIETTRSRLRHDSARLTALLGAHDLPATGFCPLFRWVPTREPLPLYDAFARRGILIRAFPEHGGVRLGLPGCEKQWSRLADALPSIVRDLDRPLAQLPEQRAR